MRAPDVCEIRALTAEIENFKAEGKTIGLCCGGFDLLHPGHVMHFNSAKKLCDVLVVAVTADVFVREFKGTGRPILGETERAYLVANVRSVDYAFVNPHRTAVEVIIALKPDRFIKGPDFIGRDTPMLAAEREAMRSVGGEALHTTDEKWSTTDIIHRILDRKSEIVREKQ